MNTKFDWDRAETWWEKYIENSWYVFSEKVHDLLSDRPRKLKWFLQRGKNGYSQADLWGFDWYLSGLIARALEDFVENKMGFPGNERFPTHESWIKFLKKKAKAFKAYHEFDDWELAEWEKLDRSQEDATKQYFKRINRRRTRLQKEMRELFDDDVFGYLWD